MLTESMPNLLQELPSVYQYYWYIVVGITGASVGSFLNVVALRQLANEEFIQTPSHCPACGYILKWYDNLPILGWLLLGGKCRQCKTPIHWQYPVVELITALLFLGVGHVFGIQWLTLPILAFVSTLILMTITDFKEHVIFTLHALWVVPIGLLIHAFAWGNQLTTLYWIPSWTMETATFLGPSFWSAFLGVICFFVFFEGLIYLSRLLMGQDAFGHGDTLILMAIASFLGWEQAVISLLLGGIFTGLFTLPLMLFQWIKEKTWGLIWKLGTAILATGGLYALNYIPLEQQVSMGISIGLMLLTVVMLFLFLREKQKVGGFTKAPFGPGLIAGALLLLFVGQTYMPKLFWWVNRLIDSL